MVSVMLNPCMFYVALSMDLFGYGCYFVVECYGVVWCGWRCSIG